MTFSRDRALHWTWLARVAAAAAILAAWLVLHAASSPAGSDAPVAIEDEPYHHVLLSNDQVEIIRANVPPGQTTRYHIHALPNAGVDLSGSLTTEQRQGKPEGAAQASAAGEPWAEALSEGPYIHRVHNLGPGATDFFVVQFRKPPGASSDPRAAPPAAESTQARVYRWMLPAGAASGMHTHRHPYVIVACTAMRLHMSAPDGRALDEQVKPGDFHWVPVQVTHDLKNDGAGPAELVEIELK